MKTIIKVNIIEKCILEKCIHRTHRAYTYSRTLTQRETHILGAAVESWLMAQIQCIVQCNSIQFKCMYTEKKLYVYGHVTMHFALLQPLMGLYRNENIAHIELAHGEKNTHTQTRNNTTNQARKKGNCEVFTIHIEACHWPSMPTVIFPVACIFRWKNALKMQC